MFSIVSPWERFGENMCLIFRRVTLAIILCLLARISGNATTSINTDVTNKSVVFFFAADPKGEVIPTKQVATGFLISVPIKDKHTSYLFLVTARHVVDPIWMGCESVNPTRLFLRVNKKQYNPQTDSTGIGFVPIDLIKDGKPAWWSNKDDNVDVAVIPPPKELLTDADYAIEYIGFRNFGKTEEIAKLNIGSQIASTGLVPGLEGQKRNYPIFKFGKVASIPDEMISYPCDPRLPNSPQSRPLRVWWLGANLVPGNSGSPVYFDPLFGPGGDISAGEPRPMIIGLQSLSLTGGDLAGMTPAKYIIEVISQLVPADADLTLGAPDTAPPAPGR